MKNLNLVIFFSFLITIYCVPEEIKTNLRVTAENSKSLTLVEQIKLKFNNKAMLKVASVASHTPLKGKTSVWICTSKGKFYKDGGFSGSINGKAPKSCKKIATNAKHELYAIDTNGKLFILKDEGKKNKWKWKSVMSGVKDVSVDLNQQVWVLTSKGDIYNVDTVEDKSGKQFGKKNYGKNCRAIAATFDTDQVIYVVDKNGDVNRQTATEQTKIYPNIEAVDICVDPSANLFIASSMGIYRKLATNRDVSTIGTGMAKHIDCALNYLWVVGDDDYPYQSSYIKN
jgi:hypothetical protein